MVKKNSWQILNNSNVFLMALSEHFCLILNYILVDSRFSLSDFHTHTHTHTHSLTHSRSLTHSLFLSTTPRPSLKHRRPEGPIDRQRTPIWTVQSVLTSMKCMSFLQNPKLFIQQLQHLRSLNTKVLSSKLELFLS